MAQWANKTIPLRSEAFSEKPTPDPPLRWENCVKYKLTLLVNENIILDTLFGPIAELVELPLQLLSKETIIEFSPQSEQQLNAWSKQQNLIWQKTYQGLIEVRMMCGLWPLVDR